MLAQHSQPAVYDMSFFDDESEKDGPASVVQRWLEDNYLERYTARLIELGYDDVRILMEVDKEELAEIVRLVGMRKGHAHQFWRALRRLKATKNVNPVGMEADTTDWYDEASVTNDESTFMSRSLELFAAPQGPPLLQS